MTPQLPESMWAVRQHDPKGKLVLETVPVPRPGHGEILVKMAASPINPSDLALLKGGYLSRDYPFTPGLEGSGTVLASGGGLLARFRKGKRVACTPDPNGDGAWAEYMKVSAMRAVPLPHSISMEQGAMMLVNPMTAMAFFQLAKEGRHRAMVNNAAASSLGKMLIRLALSRDFPLISIVRKEEQVKKLEELGAAHVLNSSSPSFESELRELADRLGATLILDAVGGGQSSTLLNAAPPGAILMTYARLSGETLTARSADLMLQGKHIAGFQLGQWLEHKSLTYKLRFIRRVKQELGKSLYSEISRTCSLEEAASAVLQYRDQKPEGKIILTMA